MSQEKIPVITRDGDSQGNSFLVSAPQISLPKGGGAIRGIGEKFSANPVTGTGSLSVPIFTSPGRSGFGPQMALSYDSGAGNGPFGLGWHLSLPCITRKTDKGLPRYYDGADSDVFMLTGAEDLVPLLTQDGKPRAAFGNQYAVRAYRPRVEGLFARIERWTNTTDPGDVCWRSISRDNITTWYGRLQESRIFDPNDNTKIFSWLICESYDDKGNAIVYSYVAEDDHEIDRSKSNERNRVRSANRYPRRIKYGNHAPYFPDLSKPDSLVLPDEWHFEVFFDYDESGDLGALLASASPSWKRRNDPFSIYRAGFEVRTYRLCQRVLMLHNFVDEDIGANFLVRSTNFEYLYEEDPQDATIPIFSKLVSVTQTGHERDLAPESLPPLTFTYSDAVVDQTVYEVDSQSLENLPYGLDGASYQWVDLDGEGASGILAEQGGAWLYKRNLSPITPANGDPVRVSAKFAAEEVIARQPIPISSEHREQLLDLAGDGDLDLAEFGGAAPGFYERTEDKNWASLTPFSALPVLDWNDSNLKFIDLTGDGHADILISEDSVFRWHLSLAEAGFGPQERAAKPFDEETGPAVIFADSTESIFLADFSGDGLTDIVRVRNGEVCYWPNLGYARFGAKVEMDNAPWFEEPDLFDGKRIRLADVDGSGTTDIIYLASDGARIYFNQSGNSWSAEKTLDQFPPVNDSDSVFALDLLGNGTACLLWSSALPGDARRAMRYIDLMGGQKPHLLIKTENNLGADTLIQYAPSTKFYLRDRLAGKPWLTRLPFPVHCVERVTVHDKWRDTLFTSSYSYHHGYYDGIEREFRGFGRVEQVDVEDYDKFAGVNNGPFITQDQRLYQPPVKTVTWYHTGVFLNESRVLSHYRDEYFPNWLEAKHPEENPVLQGFKENSLPEPDFADQDFSPDEWREALRACKGMVLRQEIYELDVNALADGVEKPVKLFSTAYHNCHIERLQPRATNPYAVFLVTESEAITYHYELVLDPLPNATPDPRVTHTLNLKTDDFGHVLQSVAIAYRRFGTFADASLPAGGEALVRKVQSQIHLVFTQMSYTDVEVPGDPDNYRVPLPWEVKTYEFTGLTPAAYLSIADLRSYQLGDPPFAPQSLTQVKVIPYHQVPDGSLQQRLVEHVRTIYFADDLTPLPIKKLGSLGLKYEDYKFALTDDLLTSVFGAKLNDSILGVTTNDRLADPATSGYLSGAALAARFAPLVTTGQYWIRSGTAGFSANAAQDFYIPERYTDPFGNITTVNFDQKYHLFLESAVDARGNTTSLEQFDFRVLAPSLITDANANLSQVAFDRLGMPAAMALLGKGNQGDSVALLADLGSDALLNPSSADVQKFFTSNYNEAPLRQWLDDATARYVYWFGEEVNPDGSVTWSKHPAAACSIFREQHVAVIKSAKGRASNLQVGIEYSDGLGTVLVKKGQAEPAPGTTALRWIATGKTILNNKGKPVKQYEPYFSQTEHRFDVTETQTGVGVTPIMYYDAPGRLIRTESPDGSYSRVEFTPWEVVNWDQNDTILEPGNAWYSAKTAPTASAEDQRAAQLTSGHAGTPSATFLDSLGRDVVAVAHNKFTDRAGTAHDEKYLTFTKLDAEGKPLWIRDARGNLVMQYMTPAKADNDPSDDIPAATVPCYDIAGNLLFQHSMDAGERWMITDAAGKPMVAWDSNQRQSAAGPVNEARLYVTTYDNLHRPTAKWLAVNGGAAQMVERFEYRDAENPDGSANAYLAADQAANLIGQAVRNYDPSGLIETVLRDFKGNLQEVHRTLNNQPQASLIDWQGANPGAQLNSETFVQITEYDALNRMTQLYNWHQGVGSRVAVYVPSYNQRGSLLSEKLTVRAKKSATGFDTQPDMKVTTAIEEIRYDEKGQKQYLALGNGTLTQYEYDLQTFRLKQIQTTRPADANGFPGRRSILKDTAIVQQLLYTYDPVGNITEIEDQAYEPVIFKNQVVDSPSMYVYDALYRLISGTGRENFLLTGSPSNAEDPPVQAQFPVTDPKALRNYTQTFTYASVGNVLEIHHDAGAGTYTQTMRPKTDSNQLDQSWDGSTVLTPVNYHYDAHGNMLNFLNVTPDLYLRWDYRDMIGSINLGGGGNAFYQYDAGKQRTRKRVEHGIIEERIYLGGYERYRKTNAGAVVEEIESHHLFEGAQRVLLVDDVISTDNARLSKGPLFRYQYSNHLGTACLELRDDTAIISYEEFHPYGTSAYRVMNSGVEVPPKRYRYTGMERDEESGLSYHSARCYAPWLGRWMSPDPMLVTDISTYSMCNGNPTGCMDRRGTQPTSGVNDASKPAATLLNNAPASTPPKPEKQFWERGYLADKIGEAADAVIAGAGFLRDRWQQRGLRTKQVFGLGAGEWNPSLATDQHGESISLANRISLGNRVTSQEIGYGYGFGRNTVRGFLGDDVSVQSVEAESLQNALALIPFVGKGFTARTLFTELATDSAGLRAWDEGITNVEQINRSSAGAASKDAPSVGQFEAVGGKRVFYVEPSPPSGDVPKSVAVRTQGNQITFDTETNGRFVELSLERAGAEDPGAHVHIGSGTHGSSSGDWAATNKKLALRNFFRQDVRTTAAGKLPNIGPRSVTDVSGPGGATSFLQAEQTAATAPPGTIKTVAAWCFSTLKK
jgi:RHS repeat-associated protein